MISVCDTSLTICWILLCCNDKTRGIDIQMQEFPNIMWWVRTLTKIVSLNSRRHLFFVLIDLTPYACREPLSKINAVGMACTISSNVVCRIRYSNMYCTYYIIYIYPISIALKCIENGMLAITLIWMYSVTAKYIKGNSCIKYQPKDFYPFPYVNKKCFLCSMAAIYSIKLIYITVKSRLCESKIWVHCDS